MVISKHIIKYEHDPWWEENEDLSPKEYFFEYGYAEGYSEGYKKGVEEREKSDLLEKKIGQLESLLSANVRVIKAELKKELENEDLSPFL